MRFFKRGSIETEAGWRTACAEYDKYLASALPKLSKGWREVAQIDFHDRHAFAVERPKRSELQLRVAMSCDNDWRPKRICTLYFTGLIHARIANNSINDPWVHTEVHLTDDGHGALQVMLRQSELRIVAEDVAVLRNYEGADSHA